MVKDATERSVSTDCVYFISRGMGSGPREMGVGVLGRLVFGWENGGGVRGVGKGCWGY